MTLRMWGGRADGIGWAIKRQPPILKQGANLATMTPKIDDAAPAAPVNPVHPRKLLLSKWTAVHPQGKDKHHLVTRVIQPDDPAEPIMWVEIEAVMSRLSRRIAWRELKDGAVWRQGWV
jgi:tryptophan-rich hypothetical protein